MRPANRVSCLTALLLASAMIPAGAATITVDTTNDAIDSTGDCSLREAIVSANQEQAGGTTKSGSSCSGISCGGSQLSACCAFSQCVRVGILASRIE
jgi:CSLREA domain-containing protein